MGSCNFKSDSFEPLQTTSKHHFLLHYVIGKGGFGKVWKLEHKKTGQLYAMKEMSKARVLSKKSVVSIMNERELLMELRHPFIVNMYYAFQDRENLYLVTDLMPGGDLRYHLGKAKKFPEAQSSTEYAEFLIACIVTSLEHLHNHEILHRDIKPENLVMDSRGYLRITDFGIARTYTPENARETSGTPGYMAPEVLCQQPHSYTADYFAVGVILHEFMIGRRPYPGRTRKEIKDQILARQAEITAAQLPAEWNPSVLDFVNRLLQRKPSNRLGHGGINELKMHAWFAGFQWPALLEKTLDAPFVPNDQDNFSSRLRKTHNVWKDAKSESMIQNISLLRNDATQQLFAGYQFDYTQSDALSSD